MGKAAVKSSSQQQQEQSVTGVSRNKSGGSQELAAEIKEQYSSQQQQEWRFKEVLYLTLAHNDARNAIKALRAAFMAGAQDNKAWEQPH
jgi:hypothetical protein